MVVLVVAWPPAEWLVREGVVVLIFVKKRRVVVWSLNSHQR